jgi:transposase
MFKYDVIWRTPRDKSIRSKIEYVIDDYVEHNMTIRSIAKKYDVSYATINSIITKNNIPKKTFSEIQKTPEVQVLRKVPQKLQTDEELEDALKMYSDGEVLEKIGEKYNISARGLKMKFRKMGVDMRTLTESANLPTTYERKKVSYQEKYGVDNPMQNPEINEKSNINRYKFKAVDIHGRRFSHLQGYEPQGIKYLIENDGLSVDDIQSGRKVPKVRYKFQGKNKTYFPDMYVESENLLVEVKCKYTYENMLELNKAKREASIKAGYNYKTIIFTNNGKDILEVF